ncbi:MAG: type IX secretion system membrane protein PorP/SprF [Lewinellaceae bacterium]|nr:type IX secretion system membrane protein PorP/SprF [Lewinellaceae bacterium]
MRHSILSIILFLAGSTLLSAQPSEIYSPLSHRYVLDNPAAMGLDGRHHLFLGAYRKWFNLEDAPQSFFVSSAHPFFNRSLGIGGTAVFDQAGLVNTLRLNLNASVHLNPESRHRFSVGASARYQNLSFGLPNVEDPLLAGEPSSSNVNLGVGLNYNADLGKDNSFFNLYVALPQFPATLDISPANANAMLAEYNIANTLLIQSNLKYRVSDGNYFIPSIRYQGMFAANSCNCQLVDLGLGMSFLDETFSVRLGVRTGRASLVYGGVGYHFGRGSSVNLFVEPGGPLGSSAAFDAELVFGEGIKPPPPPQMACWKDQGCLKQRLADAGIGERFDVSRTTNEQSDFTFVTFSFAERIDAYINYFEHEDFLSRFPLPKLFDAIESLNLEDIKKQKAEVVQVTFRVKVKNPLEDNSYELYTGAPFTMKYWQSGAMQKTENIRPNQELTESQLAGAKLHFLAERFRADIPSLKEVNVRREVVYDPSIADNRELEVVLVVK